MKNNQEPLTIEEVARAHRKNLVAIRQRLSEFDRIWATAIDAEIWEEMVFCFFTGGCSAAMGLKAVDAIRPLLISGTREEIAGRLKGVHRYPNARARYVEESRDFLREQFDFKIRQKLNDFDDPHARRDWLAKEKGIKGLGYKEASHFLRNIGFKGYGILDKHVLRCLAELKIIDDPKPPNSRSTYLTVEERLLRFARSVDIDFDEMDLVLWSIKTGKILK
ncbi:MAG: hypothetical protein LC734_07975 [Acidobacteria bacterium]|nr:hypothetical protein [Acidobacteriota bacterium]